EGDDPRHTRQDRVEPEGAARTRTERHGRAPVREQEPPPELVRLHQKSQIADLPRGFGHRSATVCHLGNISIRTGRKITWDPAKEQIVGDKEAAAMVTK